MKAINDKNSTPGIASENDKILLDHLRMTKSYYLVTTIRFTDCRYLRRYNKININLLK